MTDAHAARANEFFGARAPGLVGVVFDTSTPEEVAGHVDHHRHDALALLA